MKGARLMIRLPCRGGDRSIESGSWCLFLMPADWWPSFLVFSPANMTVFSVAFLSHAEMIFVYQVFCVYICICITYFTHGWLGFSLVVGLVHAHAF